MKKAPATTTRKGDPTPKPSTGDSSRAPAESVAKPPSVTQATFPVHDIRTEWQLASVPDRSTEKPTTATDPKEAAFLEELTQKFGSEEEARRVFALFAAMHKEKAPGATAATSPPRTVPEESTAHPSIAHSEEPQASIEGPAHDQSYAETGPSPNMEEQDVEGTGGQEDVGGFAEEIDGMEVEDLGNEDAKEEEVSVEKSAMGETPRKSEGETPSLYVEGGDPV